MKTISEITIELVKKHIEIFHQNNVVFMNCLVTGNGLKGIFLSVYNTLIISKKIIAIELLPVDQKKELWEGAKEFADNRLNNEDCIKFSKCLYVLEYFLNQ